MSSSANQAPDMAPSTPGFNAPGPPPCAAKDFHVSPLQILGFSLIFFFAGVFLCLALAFGWIDGYPDSAQKNVPIYYQSSPNSTGLSVYLHPPLNFIQANGQSQLLAFQFTNRSIPAINVRSLELFSADCFSMEPHAPAAVQSYPPLKLDSNQSVLLWYRLLPLKQPRGCPGQSPLIFLYTWEQISNSSNPQPTVEQQSISTGPVRLITPRALHLERFFSLLAKIVPLILLPVLLAGANYLLQDLQGRRTQDQQAKDKTRESDDKRREARRARRQKVQEQKLEVWKTMVPGMVQAIRDHYVPIVRVLQLIESGAALPIADHREILACAVLLRAKVTHLVDKNGGYYFHNNCGEELCANLTNTLLDRCYTLSGDRLTFLKSAETIQPINSFTQARNDLHIDAPAPGPFAGICDYFEQQLSQPAVVARLKTHVILLRQIIEREINDPFYPFWYETPPVPLNYSELDDFVTHLGMHSDDEAKMRNQLKDYFASLQPKARISRP